MKKITTKEIILEMEGQYTADGIVCHASEEHGVELLKASVNAQLSTLIKEGLVSRVDRGVFCRANVSETVQPKRAQFTVKPENTAFLEKLYKTSGAQTPDGFLNYIVEQYKEEFLKGII